MKLEKIKIKNFRGYKDEISINIDSMNVFVGKNDVGKSTILEVLDIFFNENTGTIKIDKEDTNKEAERNDENITIGLVFSNFPQQIDMDGGNETSLEKEYLLNENSLLEIKKIFYKGKLQNTYAIANHPTSSEAKDLLYKKRDDLKKIIEKKKLECNKNKNAEMREAIRENAKSLDLCLVDIDLKKEDAKKIWEKLEKHLPIYTLFQSDRSNNDQDSEVQDPIKLAVKEILKTPELQGKLTEVAKEIETKTEKIVHATLEKLKQMDSAIADQLKPDIPRAEDLKWAKVFEKIAISSDDGISLNKRGSGVKRLILLSFFMAEADKRKKEKNSLNIIYAIEEPETSQHPEYQDILIKALINLSKTPNTQIFLTTHSPSITKLLKLEWLYIIKKNEETNSPIVEKIEPNILPYFSLNEVIFIAFELVTEEYHQELYNYLQVEKKEIFNEQIKKHYTEEDSQKRIKKYFNETQKNSTEYITVHKYIRHKIHYPKNKNDKYTDEELKYSTLKMRELLKDKQNKH